MLFQTGFRFAVIAAKQEELNATVKQAVADLKADGGYKKILSLPEDKCRQVLQSKQFHLAIREPDNMNAKDRKNFVSNMEKLADDGDFLELYRKVKNNPENGRALRYLECDLYNSNAGKELLKSAKGLFTDKISFFSRAEIPDNILREEFSYSKYPEKEIRLSSLTKEQKEMHDALFSYINDGNDKGRKAFFTFAEGNAGQAAEILRTQDIREEFGAALGNRKTASRVRDLFLSEEGRKLVGFAMETAEGVNLLGYLWNTGAGNNFIESMLDVSGFIKIFDAFDTFNMIMKKQDEFMRNAKKSYREGDAYIEWGKPR